MGKSKSRLAGGFRLGHSSYSDQGMYVGRTIKKTMITIVPKANFFFFFKGLE